MKSIRMGMLLFIASEAIFFIFLLITFIIFRLDLANLTDLAAPASPASLASHSGHRLLIQNLDVPRTSMFTIILLSSSFSAWKAHSVARGLHHGWLLITILLGSIFIWGQSSEYLSLIKKDITISRDPLSTSFFTVTGFHGLHVCIGILLLIMLLFWSMIQLRRNKTAPAGSVEAISLYWHFVDLVWVAVFSIVYLWGSQ